MSTKKKTKHPLKSRLLLVIIVVIAAFLAAFLGQVLITSLNTGPTLDLNQPSFIIPDRVGDLEKSREAVSSIDKTERPSIVEIYSSLTNPRKVGEGIVLTNDGWIVTTLSESQDVKEWSSIRFNSGELLPIVESVIHPSSPLVYLQVDSENLTAATMVRENDLQLFDPVILSTYRGVLARSEYLGDVKNQQKELSSDKQNSFSLIASQYQSGIVYTLSGELMGLIIPSDLDQQSQVVNAITIRSGLDTLLRETEIITPAMGLSYMDLAIHPVIDRPSAGALITALSEQAPSEVRVNDLIVSLDGQLLNHRLTLSDYLLNEKKIGDTVELGIIRRSEPITISIEL